MINIVLDTNVLLASLFGDGVNRQALRTILSRPDAFQIYFSSQILAEHDDVLGRPLVTNRGLREEAKALLELIESMGDEVIPKFIPALVYPDEDDRPFLEAAPHVDGFLLTNNLRDFPFVGVNIMGPQEFMSWYNQFG